MTDEKSGRKIRASSLVNGGLARRQDELESEVLLLKEVQEELKTFQLVAVAAATVVVAVLAAVLLIVNRPESKSLLTGSVQVMTVMVPVGNLLCIIDILAGLLLDDPQIVLTDLLGRHVEELPHHVEELLLHHAEMLQKSSEISGGYSLQPTY